MIKALCTLNIIFSLRTSRIVAELSVKTFAIVSSKDSRSDDPVINFAAILSQLISVPEGSRFHAAIEATSAPPLAPARFVGCPEHIRLLQTKNGIS